MKFAPTLSIIQLVLNSHNWLADREAVRTEYTPGVCWIRMEYDTPVRHMHSLCLSVSGRILVGTIVGMKRNRVTSPLDRPWTPIALRVWNFESPWLVASTRDRNFEFPRSITTI